MPLCHVPVDVRLWDDKCRAVDSRHYPPPVPLARIAAALALAGLVSLIAAATGHGVLPLLATCFLTLWLVAFTLASLVAEDVNHWDWPTAGGPRRSATARLAVTTAVAAALPVALAWLLLR